MGAVDIVIPSPIGAADPLLVDAIHGDCRSSTVIDQLDQFRREPEGFVSALEVHIESGVFSRVADHRYARR